MAIQKAAIRNSEEQPVPTEIIAESIVKISKAAERMIASGLNRRALVTLIHELVPTGIGKREVAAVLDVLPQLEKMFITKPKK